MLSIPRTVNTLKRKLALLVLIILGGGMGVLLAFITFQQLGNIQSESADKLRAIALATSGAVNAALVFQDLEATETVLRNNLGQHPEIVSAAVYATPGIRFALYGSARNIPERLSADVFLSDSGAPVMHLFDPVATHLSHIEVDGMPVGYLYLRADLTDVWKRFYTQFGLSLIGVLLTFSAFLWLGLRLLNRIVTPINTLSAAARQVRQRQDYALRVPHRDTDTDPNHDNDEVSLLIDNFNAMLAEIETRDRELALSHLELEELVEQRTRQLETAKTAAEAANIAKSQFLANMSHEIRTPLNGILGVVQLLQQSAPLDEKQRLFVNTIQTSSESLRNLISDVLDLSKIEAGRLELEHIVFDLRTLLDDALDLIAPQTMRKGIEVVGAPAPDLPAFAVGDPMRLRQVIGNLLSNATKFTDHGQIQLTARPLNLGPQGFTLEVVVQDTGIGIPADVQDLIFERFQQGDSSTTRHYGGTGLGLAIAQRLLAEMGGNISLESTAGEGACFRFQVPLATATPDVESGLETNSNTGSTTHFGPSGLECRPDTLPTAIHVQIQHSGVRQVIETQLRYWGIEIQPYAPNSSLPLILDFESMQHAEFAARVNAREPELDRADCTTPNTLILIPPHRLAELGHSDLGHTDPGKRTGQRTERLSEPISERKHLKWLYRPVRLAHLRDALIGRPEIGQAPVPDINPAVVGATILLAEDNSTNQLVMTETLTGLGLQVVAVENGEQALAQCMHAPPKLILMDLHMPKMDGYQATAQIRAWEAAQQRAQRIPIVALTADALPGVEARCLATGMDGYLIKPLRRQALIALLEKHLISAGAVSPTPAAIPVDNVSLLSPPASVDLEILNELKDNVSAAGFSRIIEKFIDGTPGLLKRIRNAIHQGQANEAAEWLHQLKGSSATFGSTRLPPLCKRLELAARAGELNHSAKPLPELAELDAAFAELKQALEALTHAKQ